MFLLLPSCFVGRCLSCPSGFEYLHDANLLESEIEQWYASLCEVYAVQTELLMMRALDQSAHGETTPLGSSSANGSQSTSDTDTIGEASHKWAAIMAGEQQ